jgi:serralysin
VSKVNGNNILDGFTNSNFLTGGTGHDTFYMDDRGPTSPIFSTIVNFHKGDDATVWGVTAADFKQTILENQGAAGFTGVDILYAKAGQPDVSFVLAGYTGADITSGKLTMSYGKTQDLPNLPGSDYMTLHANGLT